jgi:hypothetical protein
MKRLNRDGCCPRLINCEIKVYYGRMVSCGKVKCIGVSVILSVKTY